MSETHREAQATAAQPRRGEVYVMSFDPTRGAEIRKSRPALIIQNDVANQFSRITIVAALSSRFSGRTYPTEVRLPAGEAGLELDSVVLCNQIRSVDKQRLGRRLGQLSPSTLRAVDRALAASLSITGV